MGQGLAFYVTRSRLRASPPTVERPDSICLQNGGGGRVLAGGEARPGAGCDRALSVPRARFVPWERAV